MWPDVDNIVEMDGFFNAKIHEPHDETMEAENHHGANGDPDDNAGIQVICAAPEADDGKDGDGVYNEIEDDVKYEYFFVNMPIK